MQKTTRLPASRTANRLIMIQAGMTVIVTCLIGAFFGVKIAQSVFLAGVIVIISNKVFASLLFRYRGAEQSGRILACFFLGELAKLMLNAGLMAAAVVCLQVAALPLLLTYVGLQILLWPAGMALESKRLQGV